MRCPPQRHTEAPSTWCLDPWPQQCHGHVRNILDSCFQTCCKQVRKHAALKSFTMLQTCLHIYIKPIYTRHACVGGNFHTNDDSLPLLKQVYDSERSNEILGRYRQTRQAHCFEHATELVSGSCGLGLILLWLVVDSGYRWDLRC